ncbi:MAG: hypothetical protein KDA28_15320, partial [Phycisphaerales bacterium]|nr:hypothetical protein [Phycisphaerales bacterium]
MTILARYDEPGSGTVTIRGVTGAGPFERTFVVDLPDEQAAHDVIPTLWARRSIDDLLTPHLRDVQAGTLGAEVRSRVVDLGVEYSILSPYTSFVAVDRLKVNVGGESRLVTIPIEMPHRQSFEGIFGPHLPVPVRDEGFDWDTVEIRLGATSAVADEVIESLRARVQERQIHSSEVEAALAISDREERLARLIEITRELQAEVKYDEAQDVVGEILAIDPQHPAGLLLHDILNDAESYRGWWTIDNRRSRSYSLESMDDEQALLAPRNMVDFWTPLSVGQESVNLSRMASIEPLARAPLTTTVTRGQPFSQMEDASFGLPRTQSRGGDMRLRYDMANTLAADSFVGAISSEAGYRASDTGRNVFAGVAFQPVAGTTLVIDPELQSWPTTAPVEIPKEYGDAILTYFAEITPDSDDPAPADVIATGTTDMAITFTTTDDLAILGRPAFVEGTRLVADLANLHPLGVVLVLEAKAREGRPTALALAARLAHP